MNNAYEVLGAAHNRSSLSQSDRPVNTGCGRRPAPHLGPISLVCAGAVQRTARTPAAFRRTTP